MLYVFQTCKLIFEMPRICRGAKRLSKLTNYSVQGRPVDAALIKESFAASQCLRSAHKA
jgi:hypothetical protein